jgi:NADPH:quinone reductase-like Zn-dependent oxidoreductase
MKAAVHTRYGPPDVVRVSDVDTPAVKEHDVLVKVHATTVNRTDCGFRAGKPFIVRFFSGRLKPKATVLGTEFAGVVEAVGSGVTSFTAGDRVFGFSEGRFGAHAEYLVMPDNGALAAMPATQPSSRPLRARRVRTTHSPTSERRRSAPGSTCSSMAPPEPSAPRRSSS